MQAADVVAHHAAVVELGSQHAALLGARHGVGLDLRGLAQEVGLARQPLVLAGLGRAGEAAGQPELAVDRLARDEVGQVLARGLGLGLDGGRREPRRTWRIICR